MIDLKILQSDWPRPFWPTHQELDLSQIRFLSRNIANNINFHFRTNSEKNQSPNFSIKSKNSIFSPFLVYFPYFWVKIFLKKNPVLSCTTSNRFLAQCQNLEKTNDPINSEWMNGQRDRPFHLPLEVQ